MSPIADKFSISDIEKAICQIDDVEAARIVVGSDQAIEEIHVLASHSKGPKQLSRDIESVLMAKYGLPVNHRKISIAQINGSGIKVNRARPKVTTVRHEVFGCKAKVTVALEYGGKLFEGDEDGPTSKMGRIRLVALATLKAVEKILSYKYSFALEDVTAISFSKEIAVIASVAVLSPNSEETFVGCAFVRGDEREAIVRSVLDAINRRFEFLTTT